MNSVRVQELEQNPSAVLARVEAGERLYLTRGDHVVAEILPSAGEKLDERPFGLAKGQFEVPDDFDAPLSPDALAVFE